MTTRRLQNDHVAGVHRSPRRLFVDAIERSLGWCAEDELRDIVERYTNASMRLEDCNSFSREIAAIIVKRGPEGKKKRNYHATKASRSPNRLFVDSIWRSLEWQAEDVQAIIERYTGVLISLEECDNFSEVVAILVKEKLMPDDAGDSDV